MTVIAVDANGADLGPAEVAAAARLAAAAGVKVLLFGPADQLGPSGGGVEIVDAPRSIAKEENPARAVRTVPDASIVLAARAVGEGRAAALVCNGSTGTALVAAQLHIRRAHGIHRPALAITVPVPSHPVTVLDVGANPDVRVEYLVQFAFMGAAYASTVLGVERPRVGLLSNGVEPERGSQVVIEAHEVLIARARGSDVLTFVGNIEGDGVLNGAADVVVTDGFTGNVALKLIEAVSQTMLHTIRDIANASTRGKLGGLLLAGGLRRVPRGDRSRGPGRRVPARSATARCARARKLHPPRHRAGDPARAPRRRGGPRRAHAPRARGCRRAAPRACRAVRVERGCGRAGSGRS